MTKRERTLLVLLIGLGVLVVGMLGIQALGRDGGLDPTAQFT